MLLCVSNILKYEDVTEIPLILNEQDQGAIFSASLYTFSPDVPPHYHTFSPCNFIVSTKTSNFHCFQICEEMLN